MIPKTIHYCWFGGNPFPEDAMKCMNSWKKYCPDYEIKRWDESNFDLECCVYVKEAYEAKKWAFITDYVRLYVLKTYGGIYMDTDVEVLKPLDDFLENHGFSGFESNHTVPTGIMAAEKDNPFIIHQLEKYKDRHFLINGEIDYTTNVEVITKYCIEKGIQLNNEIQECEEFKFYPSEYFCPKDPLTYEINLTENTYTIHHFNGSWGSKRQKFNSKVKKALGPGLVKLIRRTFGV